MNSIARFINFFRVYRFKMLSGGYPGLMGSLSLNQPLLIKGKGKVKVGKQVGIGVEASPGFWSGYSYFELRGKQASISLGDNVKLNNNASLIADHAEIRIGNDCVFGMDLLIQTGDGHNLDPAHRNEDSYPCSSVQIEENVFVGDRVTILKGVHIGKNSTIGACSVVTGDIPENTIAAGNPCRVIRNV